MTKREKEEERDCFKVAKNIREGLPRQKKGWYWGSLGKNVKPTIREGRRQTGEKDPGAKSCGAQKQRSKD